jgi:hypothetical protein
VTAENELRLSGFLVWTNVDALNLRLPKLTNHLLSLLIECKDGESAVSEIKGHKPVQNLMTAPYHSLESWLILRIPR